MTPAYFKTILREIWRSKARFVSILLIIFLGVAFYTGIRATGPDMSQAAARYFRTQRLATNSVQSTLGLTRADLQAVNRHSAQATAQLERYLDVTQTNNNRVVRVTALPKTQRLNRLRVVQGRLPQRANEIALDTQARRLDGQLKIGGRYRMVSTDGG